VAELEGAHGSIVEHEYATLGEGANAVLGVSRRSDLAGNQDIKRRPQRAGDFIGDRHPAARESEDDRIVGGLRYQSRRKLAPGVVAIKESAGARVGRCACPLK